MASLMEYAHQCGLYNSCKEFLFSGVRVYIDFITEDEENQLVNAIEKSRWVPSQSGRRKQDYGPKVNFKKQRVRMGHFTGLPAYSQWIVHRINKVLKQSACDESSFDPVEMCNLEYQPESGACIVPHLDDCWLWGDRLITLNLLSPTVLTFSLPPQDTSEYSRIHRIPVSTAGRTAVEVSLPQRSLVVVQGVARLIWLHEVARNDIVSRRIAVTFRELSELFQPSLGLTSANKEFGQQLIDTAKSYSGVACSE